MGWLINGASVMRKSKTGLPGRASLPYYGAAAVLLVVWLFLFWRLVRAR